MIFRIFTFYPSNMYQYLHGWFCWLCTFVRRYRVDTLLWLVILAEQLVPAALAAAQLVHEPGAALQGRSSRFTGSRIIDGPGGGFTPGLGIVSKQPFSDLSQSIGAGLTTIVHYTRVVFYSRLYLRSKHLNNPVTSWFIRTSFIWKCP